MLARSELERRKTAAVDALADVPVDLDQLNQSITTARDNLRLESHQVMPSVAEAEELHRQANEHIASATIHLQLEMQRLGDQEAQYSRSVQKIDRPAEEVLAAAKCDLSGIAADLENLNKMVDSEIEAAEREFRDAEDKESQLNKVRDRAHCEYEDASRLVAEARELCKERQSEVESARAVSVLDATDPEYLVQIKSKLAQPPRDRFPETVAIDLAALQLEIDAMNADDQQSSLTSRPSLTEAEDQARRTRQALDSARNDHNEQRIRYESLHAEEISREVSAATEALLTARLDYEREFSSRNVTKENVCELERKSSEWAETLGKLTRALDVTRGQLGLVGGSVVRDELVREREALERLRASGEELELESKATQHLYELLKQEDLRYAAHLGSSLAKPVTERFLELTANRYGNVLLDADLSLQKVVASGGQRDLESISVGTRHQLATLIRLALAGYLKTTLVLDDQLAHSDLHRLVWLRDQLRASVHNNSHQIIVITCRPLDYLEPGEIPPVSTPEIAMDGSLNVVDLSQVISHN